LAYANIPIFSAAEKEGVGPAATAGSAGEVEGAPLVLSAFLQAPMNRSKRDRLSSGKLACFITLLLSRQEDFMADTSLFVHPEKIGSYLGISRTYFSLNMNIHF
jgi:hypothetical protein